MNVFGRVQATLYSFMSVQQLVGLSVMHSILWSFPGVFVVTAPGQLHVTNSAVFPAFFVFRHWDVDLFFLSASGTDRPWQWLDGESLDKDDDRWNWPHPTHTGRSCLVLSGFRGETGNWMDFDCSFSAKGICEKPNTR